MIVDLSTEQDGMRAAWQDLGEAQDSETRLVCGVNQSPHPLRRTGDQAQVEARPRPALTLP